MCKSTRDCKGPPEFPGDTPPAEGKRFFEKPEPPEADELAGGDEQSLRRALELEPHHPGASVALARLLMQRDDLDEALALVEPLHADFAAIGLTPRLKLPQAARGPPGPCRGAGRG